MGRGVPRVPPRDPKKKFWFGFAPVKSLITNTQVVGPVLFFYRCDFASIRTRESRLPKAPSRYKKRPFPKMYPPAVFSGRKRNPGNFPGFNGQGGPNRRVAMAEHAAGGRTRSPTGLLRSARDLHFNIPTF